MGSKASSKAKVTAPVSPEQQGKALDTAAPTGKAPATGVSADKGIVVTAPKTKRTPGQILDDLVNRNLQGFEKPYAIVRTELGHFIAVNNRPGKLAYIVQDKNKREFKVGRTQAKKLGIRVPSKGEIDKLNAAA